MQLTFVTPEKEVAQDIEVDAVTVPGHRGQLTILPGHVPMVTTLSPGIVRYRVKGEARFSIAAVSWGYCEVCPGGIKVLAETAETPEDIDRDRVHRSIEKSQKHLQSGDLDAAGIEKYQRKLARARVREQCAKGSGSTH